MSLLDLPLELLVMITDRLTIPERVRLEAVCWKLCMSMRPQNSRLLQRLPWRISIDYTRNRNHQTRVHGAWIKLGYFPKSLLQTQNSDHVLDLIEDCGLTTLPDEQHYILIRTGWGGSILESICRYGREIRINFDRGYLPRILNLQLTGIPARFMLGQPDPDPEMIPLESEWQLLRNYGDSMTHYHPTRGTIWKIESHRLYESPDNREYWVRIGTNLVHPAIQ